MKEQRRRLDTVRMSAVPQSSHTVTECRMDHKRNEDNRHKDNKETHENEWPRQWKEGVNTDPETATSG